MKILLIDGSPKTKESASCDLLEAMKKRLSGCEFRLQNVRKYNPAVLAAEITSNDAVIIAFPLYVDSIPSHLLKALTELQPMLQQAPGRVKIYGIVNSGFYDARQNHIALSMLKLWCEASGLKWGQGAGIGGGGMVHGQKIGEGPCTSIGKTLDMLAGNISEGKAGEFLFAEPDFPRVLYKAAAHMGWRYSAFKNGVLGKLRQKHSL